MGKDEDIERFEYIKKQERNLGQVIIGIEKREEENLKIMEKKFEE